VGSYFYPLISKRFLNFPLTIGKQWNDEYQRMQPGITIPVNYDFYETFRILGWENIKVHSGKFKAVKLEYKVKYGYRALGGLYPESRTWYWYSPDVKYSVKCQLERGYREGVDDAGEREDWELTSFKLKK